MPRTRLITVCFIENIDAMGVHTGDSFCAAPMLTISTELQQKLQKYAYDVVEAIEVIGGTNIQFAHDPQTGRVVIIEINPAHIPFIGPGLQGHGLSHRPGLGQAGRRPHTG